MINKLKRKWHNLVSDQKFSEILTGSAWALSARVFATGFGLITSIIVARWYGAAMVGTVAVINSFLMLATIFTVLGTNTSLLRLIPEHLVKYSPTSAFKVYRKTQFMVIGVSLVTGTLFFFAAQLIAEKVFSKPHLSSFFALAAAFIVFKSLEQLNTQAVRGLRLIKIFALMQVLPLALNLLILVGLGLVLSVKNAPVYALLGGIAITGVAGWFVMEYAFKKKMQPMDPVQPMAAREILSISLPLLMTATMTFLIGQTGIVILGMFRSEAEVGYYAIAVKLATLTTFVLNAVNTMVGPKFAELFHSNQMDELFYVAKKSSKLIFFTTAPILLGLTLLGHPVLGAVFGQEFTAAYPAMLLLITGQFVNSISGATGLFMNMTGRQNIFRNIVLLAALTNVCLNLLLTPHYGIYGAAIAAMASIIGWNTATLWFMKSKFGKTTGFFPGLTGRVRIG
jgi:O-antigen/teichoic acid export membrane protein